VIALSALLMPLAVQEMVLAAWLIVKGFNPPAAMKVQASSGPSLPDHS
jgi:hypothetical protein